MSRRNIRACALCICPGTTQRKFAHWAADIVYTAHIGTTSQRAKLVFKFLEISVDIVRHLSGKVVIGGMPGIYLLRIACIKDVREACNIPDDIPDNCVTYKFGRTIGLYRRCGEHNAAYNKKLLGKRAAAGSLLDAKPVQ